ncbi:LOW QUALITY PROTEIN: hypothetical protein TorRG33x02_328860 [Trema orientale]|uniref:Endonuclease/exonuclease/phosphatase n=1 Tax=Trema orientale TaxID=63057 RepID=A0A2P5B9D6_TREOI|nr:LOW QUALITY PROTEIN: hypothetical protein TorRG33x02_328860 [Trema orientale]
MGGISNVQKRIDGSVNLDWRDVFPKCRVDHYLEFYGFDHRPLYITFDPILKVSSKKKASFFTLSWFGYVMMSLMLC